MNGRFPIIVLELVCQNNVLDERRMVQLKSEMTRFYGKPIEFRTENVGLPRLGNLEPKEVAWDIWENERIELGISRSREHANEVVLHQSTARSRSGGIIPDVEKFLEHLVEMKIVDIATYAADRQVRRFYLFDTTRVKYMYLGSRATIYMFNKKSFLRKSAGADTSENGMSYWEMFNIVSGNIENNIISIPITDVRRFIKTIDKELRMKLGEKEFQHLIASFV